MTERTKPTILVTGGAGYIGSHACKALEKAGYLPVAYDNLVYGHRSAVKWGPLEEGDIADRNRLESVLERYKPIAVMHFAAYAYVGESVENPSKYYRNNVAGTLTLLEAMRSQGIDKIIHLEIFGTDYDTPDGTCIRNYIHVSDLADAHLLALEYLLNGGKSDVFNLGNGNGFFVREVIATASRITGCNVHCIESDRRAGDPPILIGSSNKFQKN